MANVTLKKKTAGGTEELHPKTNWSQVGSKPTSFTPASHTHGSITNDGKIGSTANRVIVTSTGGLLAAKAAGTTSQFLRGDGAWAVPPVTGGGGNTMVMGSMYDYRSGRGSRGTASMSSLCSGISLFSRIQIFRFNVSIEPGATFEINHYGGTYYTDYPIDVTMIVFTTNMTGTTTSGIFNMYIKESDTGATTMLVGSVTTTSLLFYFDTKDSYEIELEGYGYAL